MWLLLYEPIEHMNLIVVIVLIDFLCHLSFDPLGIPMFEP